jgi:hypothetical protein
LPKDRNDDLNVVWLPERRGRSRDHFAKDFGVSGQTASDAQTIRKIGADKWQ